MAVRSTLKRVGPGLGPAEAAFAQLARKRLLVGIPADSVPRPAEPGQKGQYPSNALVGYWMETGVPEKNIPARSFLVPGVRDALPAIVTGMRKATVAALSGKPAGIDAGLHEAGFAAVAAVKQRMRSGDFPPLAQSTVEARARRRYADTGKLVGNKSSRDARSFLKLQGEGVPDFILHGAGLAQPLIDTRSLLNSIVHVIEDR